jgi:alpha-ribazole phosphatase
MTEAARLVTVLRHGEVAGPANVLRGKHDALLSAAGLQQMQQVSAANNRPAFTRIASSPLARCRTFAERVAESCNIPLTLHAGLEEIDFGDWEGLTPAEAQKRTPELFTRFQANPEGLAPPNGEAFDIFRQRVLDAFDSVARDASDHTLLVTHAGVIRVILSAVLGLTWRNAYQIALPAAASFQLSLLPEHAPYLLNLNRGQLCAT